MLLLYQTKDHATGALAEELGCAVPIFKKGYVDLVQLSAGELKNAHRKSEAAWRELTERVGKIEDLRLNVQLKADELGKLAR